MSAASAGRVRDVRDKRVSTKGIPRRVFLRQGAAAVGAAVVSATCRPVAPRGLAAEKPRAKAPDLTYLSATDMARLLRTKVISPVELLQAHLARIDAVNPKLNAIIFLDRERAMRRAIAAEKAIMGGRVNWDPQILFGVPFTVKNNLDVKGIPTVCGLPQRMKSFPEKNATVVQRFLRAGGIFLGATNLPSLAGSMETDNIVFGLTNNPYALDHTAGGSSGGEAAIIAAGGSPLGIGTDLTGSIRYPSHFCGIAGFLPAARRVSSAGYYPPEHAGTDGPLWNAIGPMARTVQDLEHALPLFVSQQVGASASGALPPLRQSRHVALNQLRVAYFTRWGHDHGTPTPEIQGAVEAAAKLLARRGAKVKQDRPSFFDQIDNIVDSWFVQGSQIDDYQREMEKLGLGDDPQVKNMAMFFSRRMREISPKMVPVHAAKFPELRQRVSAFMENYDVLITPVAGVPAVPHRTLMKNKESSDGMSYCLIANMTDSLPAGTVRVGATADGRPIGVNVVGGHFREDAVLRVLREEEAEFGGWQKPPEL